MLTSKVHRVCCYRVLVLTLMGLLVLPGCTPPAGFIGETSIPTRLSFPVGIVAGADGALWFTESGTNVIGRITTDTQTITEYCIPTGLQVTATQPCPTTPTLQPWSITTDAPGSPLLWFTERQGNYIDAITTNGTTSQMITRIGTYSLNGHPYGVVLDRQRNLWYTEETGNDIVLHNIFAGTSTPIGALNPGSAPHGIVVGPDNNVWFTESKTNVIGVATTLGALVQYCIPTGVRIDVQPCAPTNETGEQITVGPDGNLWFTEPGANRIRRLTLTGSSQDVPPPSVSFSAYCFTTTANPAPWGIAAGPDGYLWFTEEMGNKIGRINPTERIGPPAEHIGEIREFDIPTASSGPHGIAAGPSPAGRLWFTEYGVGQIGNTTTAAAGQIINGGLCSS